jgi:hypothetical protein
MTKLSLSKWAGPLLGLCLLASNVSAQRASIQIQPDVRVFAVLAALQEAGLEANTAETHPTRAAISREFQGLPEELRAKLQKFYQAHGSGKRKPGCQVYFAGAAD